MTSVHRSRFLIALAVVSACVAAPTAARAQGVEDGAAAPGDEDWLPRVEDGIVAIVNDQAVTRFEVRRALEPVVRQIRSNEDLPPQRRTAEIEAEMHKWIQRRINDLLIEQAAIEEGVMLDKVDEEVERMILEEAEPYDDFGAYEQALRANAQTLESRRRDLRTEYITRLYLAHKIMLTTISPEEQLRYYRNHIDDFRHDHQMRFSQILVRKRGQDSARRAADLRRLLAEGADFAGVARRYSEGPMSDEGGDWGWLKEGDFLSDVWDAVDGAPIGAIVGPIESDSYFHIVLVTGVREERTESFADVRDEIVTRLKTLQWQRQARVLTRKLRDRAYIRTFY